MRKQIFFCRVPSLIWSMCPLCFAADLGLGSFSINIFFHPSFSRKKNRWKKIFKKNKDFYLKRENDFFKIKNVSMK